MNALWSLPARFAGFWNGVPVLGWLVALQGAAVAFLLADAAGDVNELLTSGGGGDVPEVLAVLALFAGVAVTAREIRALLRRKLQAEARLRRASGALFETVQDQFDRWALTAAERDVALLTVRGLSIAQIAEARNTRTGTVKAQCAAVYAKAGVANRQQLLSLFLEDLLDPAAREAAPAR